MNFLSSSKASSLKAAASIRSLYVYDDWPTFLFVDFLNHGKIQDNDKETSLICNQITFLR